MDGEVGDSRHLQIGKWAACIWILCELGRSDAWISKHLGMERDEILRLKQITGLTELFKDVSFGKAWQPAKEEQ